jgi:hypothetical protein
MEGPEGNEIDGRRAFAYESVYFDSPDLLTYRLVETKSPEAGGAADRAL